ncbi:glycosyltransferase WbuB [Trinickia dinghuensis]|uniref:Colanic acid biosynthesis glycosyltransferase WcaI n=1 Tax=Trinickia dinghuensis TaxID=2291023 RepID=A0A3D8K2L2_9BURK|nr:glycosyltransferase WbuB [Trinickia dinghuensis]RDU99104.1 colanic acid biosynthesis glycosyltransferase WcaI [Trinickia dinghuensis]
MRDISDHKDFAGGANDGSSARSPSRRAAARASRVVVCTLNYAPELTGIGKYSGELVESLADSGFEVAVVTAPPYYPGWRIFKGFSNRYSIEHPHPRVSVFRCPLYVPAKPGGVKRLLHHASFMLAALPAMARLIAWRPDVVWVVEPSLMCAMPALAVARMSRAKCWLHVQDYEVDAAFVLGLIKSKWLKKLALGIEQALIRRFDIVSSISKKMLDLATTKGVDSRKLVLLPNWVTVGEHEGDISNNRYCEELGLSPESKVCLYSGNMGQKQGLEILADAARTLARRSDIVFVFCGEGSGRDDFEARCAGLHNVTFLPLQPAHRLAELLAFADVHLLPQRADVSDLVMPSKLAGMLASGRPVVATAQEGSELKSVIAQCGLAVDPGDPLAFAAAIETLIDQPALAIQYGMQGRQYALTNLDRKRVMANLVDSLALLCNE